MQHQCIMVVDFEYDNLLKLKEKQYEEYEALGARQWNVYWLAKYILCEYARVYLERDQPGDREKADKLLNQALETYQKLGAKKDIEKIIAKKKLLTAQNESPHKKHFYDTRQFYIAL